jgi:hypothetical protein
LDSALAKAAPGEKPFLIGTTLFRWLSFWRGVEDCLAQIVVARFEDVVGDPSSVIDRINATYPTTFSRHFPPTAAVFAALEAHRVSDQGVSATARPNPNIPSDDIKLREDTFRPLAEGHPLAAPALGLYRELVSKIRLDT